MQNLPSAPQEQAFNVPNPNVYSHFGSQYEALVNFGEIIAKSGFAGCTKLEQGVIVAFTCLAEKITPIEFSRTYDIIQGHPTKKAAVMLAEFRQNYKGDFTWLEDGATGDRATIQLFHGERTIQPVSYTKQEATSQGLMNKPNWKSHLPAMLRARATTKALRMYVPEIAAGIYDPNELADSIEHEPVAPPSLLDKFTKQVEGEGLEDHLHAFLEDRGQSLTENYARRALNNWKGFTDAIRAFITPQA